MELRGQSFLLAVSPCPQVCVGTCTGSSFSQINSVVCCAGSLLGHPQVQKFARRTGVDSVCCSGHSWDVLYRKAHSGINVLPGRGGWGSGGGWKDTAAFWRDPSAGFLGLSPSVKITQSVLLLQPQKGSSLWAALLPREARWTLGTPRSYHWPRRRPLPSVATMSDSQRESKFQHNPYCLFEPSRHGEQPLAANCSWEYSKSHILHVPNTQVPSCLGGPVWPAGLSKESQPGPAVLTLVCTSANSVLYVALFFFFKTVFLCVYSNI